MVITTEWDQFRALNTNRVLVPVLDLRNIYRLEKMAELDFD